MFMNILNYSVFLVLVADVICIICNNIHIWWSFL